MIFPILAIAPIVYFILSKNSFSNWLIFILVFCGLLFIIFFIGWFNSSFSLSSTLLNYLFYLLQFFFLPFIFSLLYYLLVISFKKYNSSLLVFILIAAVPFSILIVASLILIKKNGFSFVQFAPIFEQILGKDYSENNIKLILSNILEKEIPKIVSVISISLSLMVEQHLVVFTRKNEELKYIIKPIDSTRLGKAFSWITIVVIYSLIALKFILKIQNFVVEVVLFNLFYLLTSLHFINGIGVIAYYFKTKLKPIIDTQLAVQLKSRPLLFILIISAIFLIIMVLIPFITYIYFIIAFLSAVDTIYPLRKENMKME